MYGDDNGGVVLSSILEGSDYGWIGYRAVYSNIDWYKENWGVDYADTLKASLSQAYYTGWVDECPTARTKHTTTPKWLHEYAYAMPAFNHSYGACPGAYANGDNSNKERNFMNFSNAVCGPAKAWLLSDSMHQAAATASEYGYSRCWVNMPNSETNGKLAARHLGKGNMAFADGHAVTLNYQAMAQEFAYACYWVNPQYMWLGGPGGSLIQVTVDTTVRFISWDNT